MIGSILKNIGQFVLGILLLSLIVFYISRLAPGDPLVSYYGNAVEKMSVEERDNAIERLGIDEPIYIQYKKWLRATCKGEFGISFKYKQEVKVVIGEVYINTIILGGLAYFITFTGALFLGIFCALNEDKLVDKIICGLGNISSCIPAFWASLIFILIFSVNLRILPTSGAYSVGQEDNLINRACHLILPLVVLVLSHLWYYTYMIRNKLLEEIREDYVLLAKVKGLSNRKIVYKHCLRNIMPAFISIMAISIPHILAETYVVEKVFSYPGLGTLSFESAKYHDYNMLLVLCLLTGTIVLFTNMIAELISTSIDPRMKYERWEDLES
ncbi:ABC transporter permease [Clostridium gasigenes]|uniref:ABC transporter permease n=1 Tax=Clostridium gasigenes TaxID=94869 RepID=UPI00162373EA|nr:ABC transporter permease [Clostridium gasigenes]MBB6622353.1 ABC transporter permease [Clostridium gasigenes]